MQYLFIAQLIIMLVKPLLFFVLRLLGVGFVSYMGINAVLDQMKNYVMAQFGSTSQPIQQIMGLAKIDVAVNIIFSAIVTRMVLAGLDKAADLRRVQVWKAPGSGSSMDA